LLSSLFDTLTSSVTPTWLVVLLAFFPVIVWGAIFYFKDLRKEPKKLVFRTFVYGMLATIPIGLYNYYVSKNPDAHIESLLRKITTKEWIILIVFFLVVALVEEYVKHVAMIATVEKHRREFTEIVDGIVYGVAAAMGFAFVENIIYIGAAAKSVVMMVFIARAVGATFGHAIFSGTFGYFYGKAAFTNQVFGRKKKVLRIFHTSLFTGFGLHIIRTHLIPGRPSKHKHTRGELLSEGFWVAVLLHLFYDILATSLAFIAYDISFLIAPLLMISGGALIYQFAKPENQKVHKKLVNIATIPEWFIPTIRSRRIRKTLSLGEGL
jgi:RsiW-degrading membrane proteinase PrsW (M82 family)